MPSYTSVQSGYWSDPNTWSPNGVPKEGDTVTIASGHTVILDTDLSVFPNGLAGLTINGTLLIPSLDDPSYSEVGEETSGSSWLEGWSYRRTVFVDNSFSSTTLMDFQIIIRVNTAYLIQQGKMREDCGDIRVTDEDGNLLPIWIDPDTKNMWNTKVYVKVPSIPANGTVTLYLFYGNPSATDVSDASAVFDFFDDFSGTTLDETKWTAAKWFGSGTWSVVVNDGYVEISTGSGTRAGIVSNVAFPLPFIVEGKYVYVSGDHVWNSITQTTGGSHSDLVEHGYDSSGTYYTYRKASGGSYSNYQRFARYAPRGSIFTRFAIEWLTNASRYYEWNIQVNSNTNQDRYTSGSCYIQLSTYNNGISRWDWIAVRKYTATPPAVYFRTLTWTALKVNANIAGSGTLQVGSESYPITYPQKAQIHMNGTIQTAYFSTYGETRRTWDWFAQDASINPPLLYLRNGIPLRKGDILIVYSNEPIPVLDYDPLTKTVTVPRPPVRLTGERLGFPMTTLLLMTCTVDILKFGGNNVYYAAGSNFTFIGTFFTRLPLFFPSSNGMGANLTNPQFRYCCNYRMTANDYDGHWVKAGNGTGYWQWCAVESGTGAWGWAGNGWPRSSTSTIEDCCTHNPRWGMSFQGSNTWLRCYQQGGPNGLSGATTEPGSSFEGCVLINSGGSGLSYITVKNCQFINASGLGGSYNVYENITFYNDNGNRSYLGGTRNIFRNITLHLNSTHWNILLSGARQCTVRNVMVNSYVNAPFLSLSNDVWSDNIIQNVVVNGQCHVRLTGDPSSDYNLSFGMQMLGEFTDISVPVLSNNYGNTPGGGIVHHPAGYWNIKRLIVPTLYNRAAVHSLKWDARFTLRPRLASSVRIGELTVGSNNYPEALEFIGFHGWAKNRWDVDPPEHNTFDFYLNPTVLSYYGVNNIGPVIAWWVFMGAAPIRVSGTITRIGSGEKVKVTISRYPKEPFLGDSPEFEQEFTEAGDIAINWSPPDVGPWIVRILAYLNQTTNPITIANLEVTSGGNGGGGGGGGSQNFFISEQMNVLASEAVSTQVLAQVAVDSAIISSERVEPLVQASVSDSMQASTVESVATQVFATPSESVQVSAVEYTVTDLSVIASESAQVQAVDAIMPELSIAASETMQVNASEATAISLPVGISEIVQIQTDESVTVSVSIDANETTQLLSTDSVTTTIGLTVAQTEQIVNNENVQVTDFRGVQIEVSDSVQIIATEIESTDIVIDMTQTESIVVDESLSTQLGISVSDAMQSTLDETVTTAIQPQLSESVRVTTLEESTTDIQISAQTQTEVSATDVASATIGVAVADSEIISATEASSTTVAPSVSEVVRVTTVEQPVSQIQLSAVESVTQIETETGQFVGLVQRIITPLGVDLDNVIGIDISIQPIQLEAGVE